MTTAVRVTPPALAVMVAVSVTGTRMVVMVKVACVRPCGTVTVGGGCATLRALLDKLTRIPPVDAGAASTTRPNVLCPPVTWCGEIVNDDRDGAGDRFTVNVCVTVKPWYPAEMVAMRAAFAGGVLIVNVPTFCPEEMVNIGGTRASETSVELSEMTTPPAGAASANVTDPVTVLPPTTGFGSRDKVNNGLSVTCEVSVVRLYVALKVTGSELFTATVAIWKVTEA